MFGIEQWLPLSGVLILILQSGEIKKISSHRWLAACLITIGLIIVFANQYLVQYSTVQLHQLLQQHDKLVGLILLLDTLLIIFSRANYPVPSLTAFIALFYFQMHFYQLGWFNWTFTTLAILYAFIVISLIFLIGQLSHRLTMLKWGVLSVHFMLVSIALMQPPSLNSDMPPVSIYSLGLSLIFFIALIFVGYCWSSIKNVLCQLVRLLKLKKVFNFRKIL
ncbi:hypothetical protein [Aliikangiella sp. IMCC44359]|uniref:hypothetical protein n=1 Tax=Aliikangiella sp. IMCC44359 TaxID=3459125 RepID=UPI00403B2259